MPQGAVPRYRDDYIAVRDLARRWGVIRTWLAGVVVGMDLVTARGPNNETMIAWRDVALLKRRVEHARGERLPTVSRG